MVYAFELVKHANTHYREAVVRLGAFELQLMLNALSIKASVSPVELGGSIFLTFESPPLSTEDLGWLHRHSTLCFFAEKQGSSLYPLAPPSGSWLPEELPEVLKYKGKTAPTFTRMMLNSALSLSAFARSEDPITVLDPLCGRGTTLFSAVQLGMNAAGLDTDKKDLMEASTYFSRFLKMHALKHSLKAGSETLPGGQIPFSRFVFSDSKEHYSEGNTRFLLLGEGDTGLAPALVRRHPVHVLVADLPYGVQHAPQSGRRPESFDKLLSRALPRWKSAMLAGGAMGLSFNTLTLPTDHVLRLVREAGFLPCEGPAFSTLTHEVEHAVVRNVIFAVKHKEEQSDDPE